MAEKRVIVHFMHEHELHEASQKVKDGQTTESYVIGDVEESDIAGLEQKGLIVQPLEERPATEETPGANWELRGTPGPPRPMAAPSIDEAGPNFYLVALSAPLIEQWRAELDALDVELLERIPPSSYTARLTPDQARAVRDLAFVANVRVYAPEDTGPVDVISSIVPSPPPLGGPQPDRAREIQSFDVRLHRGEDRDAVLRWLEAQNIDVAGSGGRKIRVYALEASDVPERIRNLPEVAEVAEFVPPQLHNDVARQLLGIDDAGSSPAPVLAQEGEGEIVAVADTGLDESHPDFQGRIVGVVPLGRQGDASDPHGHGTHVAGSVLGDGSASNGQMRGAAPQAQLFFQSLLDGRGGLGGLPVNLGDLFEEAYQAGARVHNNSWGSATASLYTINSEEVDDFVARRRDMLIVISAGNEGQAANRLHSAPGFPDWLSIGSPASCKNALTVGASRSSRSTGGLSALTWGDAWPDDFPDPPIAGENVSGNADGLAAFSSRGPCDDRRIKPDLVAPGTDIGSARSSRAPLRRFWGPFPGNARYAYMGGTSMAAPLVAGCAALVREYYRKLRGHEPSAALLKATLINSTRWLGASDSVADHAVMPNYHQGFGCIHMPSAIPNPSQPGLELRFVDPWQDPPMQFVRSGQRFRWRLSVASGRPLRVCLAWTDLAARALQNNLNLIVEDPAGQKHVGNVDLPQRLGAFDPENNVEVLRFDDPAPGDYLIMGFAYNLLKPPQDYALVVTGALTSDLVREP
jgi:subtilisin family serine protease